MRERDLPMVDLANPRKWKAVDVLPGRVIDMPERPEWWQPNVLPGTYDFQIFQVDYNHCPLEIQREGEAQVYFVEGRDGPQLNGWGSFTTDGESLLVTGSTTYLDPVVDCDKNEILQGVGFMEDDGHFTLEITRITEYVGEDCQLPEDYDTSCDARFTANYSHVEEEE